MSPDAPVLFFDSGVGGLSVLGPTRALLPDVVLNEIFSSPPSGDATEEFVELKNRTTHSVDVSGWRLRGGVSFARSS